MGEQNGLYKTGVTVPLTATNSIKPELPDGLFAKLFWLVARQARSAALSFAQKLGRKADFNCYNNGIECNRRITRGRPVQKRSDMPPMRETADARRSPPFHWDGEKAVADWMNDFAADAKAHGVTDDAITIAKPLHLTVEHALFIASLVRRGGTWLISNWAYGLK